MRLINKAALITGGTSGIGQATVELFIEHGAKVAFTGRRKERGEAIAQQTGAVYIRADHHNEEDCATALVETLRAFDRLDILFNNAGIVTSGTAETTSSRDWFDVFNLNVTAVWRMSKLVIPVMRSQGGGVIINNASDWGLVGARNALAYATSKGAVIQMTRCMALDHAKDHIRVNAVCPGDTFVERWIEQGFFRGSVAIDEIAARESTEIPLGRVAESKEIAQAVLFLACEEASFVTGSTLVVDGGNTAQ